MSTKKNEYNKNNYVCCNIRIKPDISDIINSFASDMGISKATLIQKCVLYCYNEMIDISAVKLGGDDRRG